ncbi:MAG: Na+/H+ antiporter NhaA [Myxococcota bacterium]
MISAGAGLVGPPAVCVEAPVRPVDPRLPAPPEAWSPAQRVVRAVAAPVERFLAVEASSGILLLVAAVFALLWANSPWRDAYEAIWTAPLGVSLGSLSFERDLRWWVNDGLMAIFFFVVGLEIRREIHHGELSELRRAALPLAAALGGMLLPALLYTSLNAGLPSSVGWGVPMATDIAFAVGVLALLGDRVAPSLRILLLSLAVIDDLGAILVIAFFYSDGISFPALALSGLGLLTIPVLQRFGARSPLLYLPGALLAWGGAYASGVHPTIAGVAIGLLTPVTAWLGPTHFVEAAERAASEVRAATERGATDIQGHFGALAEAAREAVSPVERMQHMLHGWVAYLVMPLFAFANAGVALGDADLSGEWRVFAGVFLGLLVGKPLGVLALSRLAAASGIAAVPSGMRWAEVAVVGLVAGIGFTMALFIAQLAFPPGPALETAKLGILAASLCAGVLGYIAGRLILRRPTSPGAARSAAEAERATHA